MKAVFNYFNHRYQWPRRFPTNPELLVESLFEQGIEKAFTLAYTHKPGLSRKLNSWLANFCLKYPELEPFGAIHPDDQGLENIAIECLDHYNFPGIKIHCLVQQCRPDDKKLYPLYETVVERSKGIIIHASSFPLPYKDYLGIKGVSRLLDCFPGLNIIIPHLGLHDLHEYGSLLERYEGLFLDTSFVFHNQVFMPPLDIIREMMLAYPDRIIYGSDYPFILETAENGIGRILELDLPVGNYKKLFCQNAELFLNKITGHR